MRIVLLPSNYAPAIGGIEEVTRQLARQLRHSGDEVEVWTHRHPETLPLSEEIEGVQVRRFSFPLPSAPVTSLSRWLLDAGSAQRALADAMRQFSPDLLHVHGFSGNGVHATMASFLRRVPLVVTLHGETAMDDQRIYDHSASLRLGLRLGLRRAAAVTAPSRFILDDARRFATPSPRERVIPNGVDLQEPAEATSLAVPFERFVLALGRVVPNKGFDLLLRAFAPLVPDRPGLGLVVAGDGPHLGELLALAEELGISRHVIFPGWLDRGQIASVMGQAEVFVVPSRLEPFGVVVLEAMRAGLPVVATSRGGVGEWTEDGVSALLVDPVDTERLTDALRRVLDDENLASELSSTGMDHVAGFDWSTVSERYRSLYAEVLSR